MKSVLDVCHAAEVAAAHRLEHPRRSMLVPAWKRMNATLQHAREMCRAALLAVRAHRKRMRERVR